MALPVRTQNSVGLVPPSWGLANTGLPDDALVMTHMSVLVTVLKADVDDTGGWYREAVVKELAEEQFVAGLGCLWCRGSACRR